LAGVVRYLVHPLLQLLFLLLAVFVFLNEVVSLVGLSALHSQHLGGVWALGLWVELHILALA